MHQQPWVVPIPGGTKLEHVEENLAAANVVLTPDDLQEIEDALTAMDIEGAPLSEGLDATIDR